MKEHPVAFVLFCLSIYGLVGCLVLGAFLSKWYKTMGRENSPAPLPKPTPWAVLVVVFSWPWMAWSTWVKPSRWSA